MAIVNVVQYNGGNEAFAWKYPISELATWTQLIVNESQEAVLVKTGMITDIFTAGRYVLDTNNIPILNKIINIPFGGKTPFTAEVWYINKSYILDIKWGTPTPIQIQDPKYGLFIPVRANGMFGLRIIDSRKFLTKLVGTMYQFDRENMKAYFKGLYISKVKDCISSYFVHKKVSALEINAYLDEISSYIKQCVINDLYEYGIELVNFYINDISVPKDDSGVLKLKEALAKRAEMNIIGYDYRQERSFDTLESAAKNQGSASSAFMGAGIGLSMGNTMGGMFAATSKEMSIEREQECPKCHQRFPVSQRFCGKCGYDSESSIEKEDTLFEKKTKKIVCAACKTEISSNAKFCMECGKKYMPCPQCGCDLEENAVSCPECGYKFEKLCGYCGALAADDAKFCIKCGRKLD